MASRTSWRVGSPPSSIRSADRRRSGNSRGIPSVLTLHSATTNVHSRRKSMLSHSQGSYHVVVWRMALTYDASAHLVQRTRLRRYIAEHTFASVHHCVFIDVLLSSHDRSQQPESILQKANKATCDFVVRALLSEAAVRLTSRSAARQKVNCDETIGICTKCVTFSDKLNPSRSD